MTNSTERTQPPAPRVMRTPRSVDIEITGRCNLRCRYCYFFFDNPAAGGTDLPTDEWQRFFAELGALGVMDVFITGGEPMLRPDLPALLDAVVRARLRFKLASNGTLISEAIAAQIAHTGRCNFVQVSVDGARPETHEAGRGKRSFESAVRGIRLLQRYGVDARPRVTLHRENAHDLEDAVRLLLDDLQVRQITINVAGYLGAGRVNGPSVMLTARQLETAMETGQRLAAVYRDRIAEQDSNLMLLLRTWQRMEAMRAAGRATLPECGRLCACGCPTAKLTVRPDGAMIPCSMLPHIVLGQINRDSLVEVWQQSAGLNALRARRAISLETFAFCSGCEYIGLCTGGCPGPAYYRTGQVDHPNPDSCLRQFRARGGVVPLPITSAQPTG